MGETLTLGGTRVRRTAAPELGEAAPPMMCGCRRMSAGSSSVTVWFLPPKYYSTLSSNRIAVDSSASSPIVASIASIAKANSPSGLPTLVCVYPWLGATRQLDWAEGRPTTG